MRVDFRDLRELEGGGGEPFQSFLYALLQAEGRKCGISPSMIDFDDRVNIGDGGRDIVIRATHAAAYAFIPRERSIWSAKAGADGTKPSTLRKELKAKAHETLRDHLKDGGKYVWCVLQPISQSQRDEMWRAAEDVALELDVPAAAIEFRWRDSLTTHLNDHPHLITSFFPALAEAFADVHTLSRWEREDKKGFGVAWVDFGGRDALKQQVREHLLGRGGANVLHLVGLSGIGKTRTVLEACREDQALSGVFYVPKYEVFSNKFQRYLEAPDREASIVVDEMPLSKLDAFTGRVEDFTERLRFLTIGPTHRGLSGARTSGRGIILLAEPDTDTGVLEVARRAAPGLSQDVLRSIAQSAAHDLRLALLLVQATMLRPELREIPIVDVEDIWSRLMYLYRDRIGDEHRFREHYCTLVTCIDVGRNDVHRRELEYLANVNHIAPAEIDRSMVASDECGLGTLTPSFFEAGPRALAVQVFQDRVWPTLAPRFVELMRGMPTERLQRRFIERCQECSGEVRRQAEQLMEFFFRQELGEEDLLSIADRQRSSVFQAWAELDPRSGLTWLKRSVSQATREQLLAFDGRADATGRWRGRRQIVWLCENLACFADYFFDCEDILFRLAQVETEPAIGNNSVETWRSMFWVTLSRTEVPFPERLNLLLRRLREVTTEEYPLVLSAAMGIFGMHGGRVASPRVVGGRIVPEQWRPKEFGELRDLLMGAATRILQAIGEREAESRGKGIEAVLTQFGTLASNGLIEALHDFFGKVGLDENTRRLLVGRIDEEIGRIRMWEEREPGKFAASQEALLKWREELSEDDLAVRIKDLTAQDYWAIARVASRNRAGESPDLLYEKLAAEVLSQPESLLELEGWLESPEAKSGAALGFALGKIDRTGETAGTVTQWLEEGRSPLFVIRYLRGISYAEDGLPSRWSERLDSVATKHPLFVTQATLEADPGRRGFRRVLELVPYLLPNATPVFRGFGYPPWHDILKTDEKLELLNVLADSAESGNHAACIIAIELIQFWMSTRADEANRKNMHPLLVSGGQGLSELEAVLVSPLLRMAEFAVDKGIETDEYGWEVAMRLLAFHRPEQAADILVRSMTDHGRYSLHLRDNSSEILSTLAREHPSPVMEAIGRAILDPERRVFFRFDVYRGLLEAIGLPSIRDWIRSHGSDMAVWFARHLPAPSLAPDGAPILPPLTEWFLTEYEGSDDLFAEFCAGRHSFEFRYGPASARSAEIERLTRPFLSHRLRRVREWAEYELELHRRDVEFDKRRADEFERT